MWEAVSQSQGAPLAEQTPWPNWVILKAVQRRSGRARIRPATTLVLPMLRVLPPTTTRVMGMSLVLAAGAQACEVAEVLLERAGRAAPEDLARAIHLFAGKDAGAAAENNARADGGVFADTDLAAKDGTILDDAGAGDTGLGGDDDVAADDAVVADMDEVVDLGAAADAGLAERAAVDGGIRADVDVVFDGEGSLLWEEEVLAGAGMARVAEAPCAEDGPGLYVDEIAKGGPGIEGDIRGDTAMFAKDYAIPEDRVSANRRVFAKGDAAAEDR